MEQKFTEIEVFHGTNHKHFASIKQSNFKVSTGASHEAWLGDGVYFFTEGVPPNADESAENWAKTEAWDNTNFEYVYRKYCIIRALVNAVRNVKCIDVNTITLLKSATIK